MVRSNRSGLDPNPGEVPWSQRAVTNCKNSAERVVAPEAFGGEGFCFHDYFARTKLTP